MVSRGSRYGRVCTGGNSSMTNNGVRSKRGNNCIICRKFSRDGRFG